MHSEFKLYLSYPDILLPGMVVTVKAWQQPIIIKLIKFGFRAYLFIQIIIILFIQRLFSQ